MSDFSEFDFYRVGSWKSEGLFITVSERSVKAAKAASKAIAKVAVGAAFVLAGAASTVSAASEAVPSGVVIASVSNASAESPIAQAIHDEMIEYDLAKMSTTIDADLANLLDFSVGAIDEEILALAAQAVAQSSGRAETDFSEWATALVGKAS